MGIVTRLVNFGVGSLIGAAVGAAVGTLTAPADGASLQSSIRRRFQDAKVAGDQAQAEKQAELVERYRAGVKDPDALDSDAATQSRGEAVVAMGLGLNAPGMIASQQAADRDDEAPTER